MPNQQNSYTIGLLYEKKAVKLLQAKGFQILKHNYRGKYAQVDIVCRKKNKVYLVEVKKTSLQALNTTVKRFQRYQKNRLIEESIFLLENYFKKRHLRVELLLIIFANNSNLPLLLYQHNPPKI